MPRGQICNTRMQPEPVPRIQPAGGYVMHYQLYSAFPSCTLRRLDINEKSRHVSSQILSFGTPAWIWVDRRNFNAAVGCRLVCHSGHVHKFHFCHEYTNRSGHQKWKCGACSSRSHESTILLVPLFRHAYSKPKSSKLLPNNDAESGQSPAKWTSLPTILTSRRVP